jgi:hypothetical protein
MNAIRRNDTIAMECESIHGGFDMTQPQPGKSLVGRRKVGKDEKYVKRV